MIKRIPTPTIQIGKIKIGGTNPIVIQSMTNTDTADPAKTAEQCIELAKAGSELVRVTVNNEKAAQSIPELRQLLNDAGYQDLPLIGDFHFNGHTLLKDHPKTAQILDKYRINPGNVGFGNKHDYNIETLINTAIENDKPVRIGVNWGSLDRELLTEMMNQNAQLPDPKTAREVIIAAMVESALRSTKLAHKLGLPASKIILSVKMSVVQDVIEAYQLLTQRTAKNPYALHLGLTEAGTGLQGTVSSSAALAILLQQGIGDTIRISLTPSPGEPRTKEVEACKHLLQSLGFRHFQPKVTSCPGCGRTDSTFFQDLAKQVNEHIKSKMPEWKAQNPQVAEMKVAIMGCIVNGPGESSHADIAISLPGNNEEKMAPIFMDGRLHETLLGDDIPAQFIEILENYVKNRYFTK